MARQLEAWSYEVQVESPRVGGYVDILATKAGRRLAVEIETGKSDAVQNARNCLRSGFEKIWTVATTREAFQKVSEQFNAAGLILPERIRLMTPQAMHID
jgi:predicted RecB family endonuclease